MNRHVISIITVACLVLLCPFTILSCNSEKDTVLYGKVISISQTKIQIQVATMKKMSSDENPKNRSSHLDLTGETRTIVTAASTRITKNGMQGKTQASLNDIKKDTTIRIHMDGDIAKDIEILSENIPDMNPDNEKKSDSSVTKS